MSKAKEGAWKKKGNELRTSLHDSRVCLLTQKLFKMEQRLIGNLSYKNSSDHENIQ
jgi:hypothetical protein